MFQFPGLALNPYVFRVQYLLMISVSPKTNPSTDLKPALGITEIEGGFPHSEIRGSKLIRSSPRLIAAYHVLHRLSAPRHPPNALKALDRSHDRCPRTSLQRPSRKSGNHLCNKDCRRKRNAEHLIRKTIMLAECTRFNRSRWCRTFHTLQDEQLSNTFPLHNDKQQRNHRFR